MPEVEIGTVMDYFARPMVAGTELTRAVEVGDRIHIKSHTTDMELTVESMQIESVNADEASAGQAIGLKVSDRVRRGDKVHTIVD